MLRSPVLALAAWTSVLACGPVRDEASQVQVTNGVETPESTYPSVALLIIHTPKGQHNCTGTFLSDAEVLTAAHCIEPLKDPEASPIYYVRSDENGKPYAAAEAEAAIQYPGYNISVGTHPSDLAIVRFPAGTAPAIAELGPAPVAGDTFTIVGYGNNDFSYRPTGELLAASGALTLRKGSNEIYNVGEGLLYFLGVSKARMQGLAPGSEVSAGQGDSGGPMFVKGKLVGVASGVGYGGENANGSQVAVSAYVDLNTATSREFLKRALSKTQ